MKKFMLLLMTITTTAMLAACGNNYETSSYTHSETDNNFGMTIIQNVSVEHVEDEIMQYHHEFIYPQFFDGMGGMMAESFEQELSHIENYEDYVTIDTGVVSEADSTAHFTVDIDVEGLASLEDADLEDSTYVSLEELESELAPQGFDKNPSE